MTNSVEQIKVKLNIKYSAAKQLIQEAKVNLEISGAEEEEERIDEILDEATQIFEDDLLPEEQEEMRSSGQVKSDFKQRAMAAAQRREAAQKAQQVQEEAQPTPAKAVAPEEDAVDDQPVERGGEAEAPAEEVYETEEIEEYVEEEGDGGGPDGGVGETITQTVEKTVAADGTQVIRTKTTKRTVTEQKGTKAVVCCTIL